MGKIIRLLKHKASMTVAVIVFLVLVFLYQNLLTDSRSFSISYSTIPLLVSIGAEGLRKGFFTLNEYLGLRGLVTSIFLHGDIKHLASNAFFFWIFGSLVEGIIGKGKFLLAFLLTGVAGNLAQVFLNPTSLAPVLGASGSVCGMEGLYLALALQWKLSWPHVWPMANAIPPFQLGIVAIIGIVMDVGGLYNGEGGIAFGAHVGGFVAGITMGLIITNLFPQPKNLT